MEEKLRVAVCEDTPADARALLAFLEQSEILCECSVYSSGEEFLADYRPRKFDLLLTDIYMGGITGVEMVSRIRQLDEELPVAFITTSTDHTLESYRLSALKYIEKPFRAKDVNDILKLAAMERASAPTLTVQKAGREEHIRFSDIVYAEQKTHQLLIRLFNGTDELVYEKLSAVLPQLEQQDFFSPHKSYAANLAFVKGVNTELKCFEMADGSNVPIRRESMGKAKKALTEYLFRRTREAD